MRRAWDRLTGALRGLPAGVRLGRRGFGLVAGPDPRGAAAFIGLVVLLSALPVVQVWLSKLVVDELTPGAGSSPRVALALAAGYALTLLVPAALDPVRRSLSIRLEDRAVGAVDRHLMEAGRRLEDLVRIERPAFQDELRTVQDSIWQAPRLLMWMDNALGNSLTLVGLLGLLGGLHPVLPLALIAAGIPQLFADQKAAWLAYEAMTRRSRAAREMDYCARIATEPDAAKEVRVFGLGGFFLARFEERFSFALSEVTSARLRHLRISSALGGIQALAAAGGFWYVAARAGAGALTLGDIALYLNAVAQALGVSSRIRISYAMAFESLLHIRGIFNLLDNAKARVAQPEDGRELPAPATLRSGVELREVSFTYPEGDERALDGVSFALRAGEVTALVGANGVGKSTLVKLLTRMYDPDEGEILLDGRPLREYELSGLRRAIAVVYQDFARFALSLRENIAVGADEPGRAETRVERVAGWAGADEVAGKLGQGYDTQLTRRFEGGVEVSGGEWQKVALARGFVRDAALVILDEPTSALDADAEHRLFERFRKLMRGRTALIISHRFSTVRMADRIVVLEGGRVLEQGTHAELTRRGGRYAELFEMQAGRYR